MCKHGNTTKAGESVHKDASPAPSSHGGQLYDTAQDLTEEVASETGTSPKTLFRFAQLSRSPSACSPSLEHQQAHSTIPKHQMHYCIHISMTLEEGKGYQPSPSHMWSGSLITDILQEACPGDWITKAVVLLPGEEILFFRRCSLKEGLLYSNAQDVELSLRGPVSLAGRTLQVEMTINTMEEDPQAIVNAIMEKKTQARGPWHPQGLWGATWSSAVACTVNDWM